MPLVLHPLTCPYCGRTFWCGQGEYNDVMRGFLDAEVVCPDGHYKYEMPPNEEETTKES